MVHIKTRTSNIALIVQLVTTQEFSGTCLSKEIAAVSFHHMTAGGTNFTQYGNVRTAPRLLATRTDADCLRWFLCPVPTLFYIGE